MNKTFVMLCLGVTASISAISTDSAADTPDLVAASFSRMLHRATTVAAPNSPTQLEDDPLFQRLTARVWLFQPSRCAVSRKQDEMTVSSAAVR